MLASSYAIGAMRGRVGVTLGDCAGKPALRPRMLALFAAILQASSDWQVSMRAAIMESAASQQALRLALVHIAP